MLRFAKLGATCNDVNFPRIFSQHHYSTTELFSLAFYVVTPPFSFFRRKRMIPILVRGILRGTLQDLHIVGMGSQTLNDLWSNAG